MLNSEGNSICLLPTGGGKSLIYYFMGLLNPNPIIIVSPTSILIHDQIRNMKYFHNIDDVYRIDPVFNYSITPNKFIFITPETLQHYYIISKIINWNVNSKVSYVVLDEVHTICNWSHDFRPAYLMLSHNLMSFIDNTSILSFTATANYKVLSDLIAQINIKKDNIFSPVELKKENIIFEFYPVANEEECCSAVGKELENFVYEQTNEKAIVFSKNTGFTNSIIDSLSEASKYEISTYDSQNIYSYEEFVKGYTKVLLADIDLGVGLNLPKVSMTVHNGTPISKAQYVQEIGRAGREGDTCKSKVFFKSKEYLSDDELKLINYNTSIDELIYLIRKLSNINEIASTFKRMFGHIENQAKSSQNIMDIYTQINGVERYTSLEFTYDNSEAYEEISRLQKYLYVLFRIGVIHNWFIIEKSLEKNTIKFFIEVTEEKDNLNYIKHKISEYLNSIGKYKEKIYEIKNAKAISDIIFICRMVLRRVYIPS